MVVTHASSSLENSPPLSKTRSAYRPEIDGLRSLAVLAVIVNHFNPALLPSGFLGVDVFFVISGFVVTSSLANKPEQSWKKYLLSFYARRVKRIFPALVTCVVLTSVIGCLFISQPERSLDTGLIALIGGSNIHLFLQSYDYFSQFSELDMFTQTWSLGVEEQFYLVFPILLGVCGFSQRRKRHGARTLFRVVMGLSVLSLVSYLFLSQISPDAAFFLMPSRFWQLGLGCLVFLVTQRLSVRSVGKSAVGLKGAIATGSLFLLVSVLFFPRELQTLSTVTVTAVTGSLLWSFDQPKWLVRLLSASWMVKLGKLSYSLYLWHWSVLVISRWTIGVSKWTIPIQLLLIVGLASASNRWIETPLRYKQWSTSQLKTIGTGVIITAIAVVLLLQLKSPVGRQLYTGPSFPDVSTISFPLSDQYQPCEDASLASEDLSECFYPIPPSPTSPSPIPPSPTLYFVGDSHTRSLQALASRLVENNDVSRIMMLANNGCLLSRDLLQTDDSGPLDANCQRSNQAFLSKIMKVGEPGDIVVLVNRYAGVFTSPNYPEDILEWESSGIKTVSTQADISRTEAIAIYRNELVNWSNALAAVDMSLVVQASLPDWKHLPDVCTPVWFYPAYARPKTCQLSASEERQHHAPTLTAFRSAASQASNLYVYDPFSIFCQSQQCSPFSADGTPLFMDDDHLNNQGAEALYASFTTFLKAKSLL